MKSLDPATLKGFIDVIDHVGADKTALTLSIEALEKAGYEYKYQNADKTLVAMMGDRIYTFTMNIENAYCVQLKRAAGSNIVIPDAGDFFWVSNSSKSFEGKISRTDAGLAGVTFTATASGTGAGTVKGITVTPSETDAKTGKFVIEFTTVPTDNNSVVTIGW